MKIRVLSDLHLEFGPLEIPECQSDVVVLAGDIHQGTAGIDWAAEKFPGKRVLILAGNHEFYGREVTRLLAELRAAAARTKNVTFLENDELTIDGVRFLGCTLWTDMALFGSARIDEAMSYASLCINDFRLIKLKDDRAGRVRRFTPADAMRVHRESVKWLEVALRRPGVEKTVVITHHCPHWRSVPERFVRDMGSPAFASHLEHLMGPGAVLWIHGHTHDTFDYEERSTRVVCNPRGYAGYELNPDFDPGLVIEI